MEDFIGKYNGGQIESRLDKVKDMVGATASAAGSAGLVPAPTAGKQASFLRGDGVWADGIATEWVDISSYILQGADFKENATKEGFDKIKSCIINKQHMYIHYKIEMGGDVVALTVDFITSFLYVNIFLVMVDVTSPNLKQVVIDSSDYSITVTEI